MRIFAAELDGGDSPGEHESDWLGTDPHTAFTTAAALDRAAWHRPGALTSDVHLSFGPVPGQLAALIHLTELVVHTADLAVTTAQEHQLDPQLCDDLLTTMHESAFDAFRRPGMFGPELSAPTDAAHHRLLAFTGRELRRTTV